MNSPFSQFVSSRLEQIAGENLLRQRRVVQPLGQGRCRVEDRELWDFSSNDYHGFSQHPEVIQAASSAMQVAGVGARASLLISGFSPTHQQLFDRLRDFEAAEDVLICATGYAACQGAIAAVVEPEDTVFCDRLNHACLIDGIRLSQAKLRIYRSEDLDKLRRELSKTNAATGRRWIITETVFGMDGTLAPLVELVRLAEEFDACLICDEAHATGAIWASRAGVDC